MALVDSLLTAIVRVDGDALVLHAGERPYVVAPSGQSEIASRVLTLDAMVGMLGELLPGDGHHLLGGEQPLLPGLRAGGVGDGAGGLVRPAGTARSGQAGGAGSMQA